MEQKPGSANKYARIYALSPDRKNQVDAMLLKSIPAIEVAKHIIEVWGLYAGEEDALAKQLTRYRTEYIDANLAARAQNAARTEKGRLMTQIHSEQLVVLDEMFELIQAQKMRINKYLELEENSPFPFNAVKFEMKTLVDMYKLYSQLQLETGILQRAKKHVSGHFHIDEEAGMIEFEAEINDNAELRKATVDIMKILEGEYEVVTDSNQPDRGTQLSCLE